MPELRRLSDAVHRSLRLSKSYPVGEQPLTVLRDLDLPSSAARWSRSSARRASARARCCTCSAGSTRSMPGIGPDRRDELSELSDAELVAFRNRHVGFVFQFHHLLPEFTRARERRDADAHRAAAGGGARAGARRNCCSGSGSASGWIIGRGCCRAVSSSGSRSRARW